MSGGILNVGLPQGMPQQPMGGQPQMMPQQQQPPQPGSGNPVIDAARAAGADPDALLKAKDLNGLIAAALKGNPQLDTDMGHHIIDSFAQAFKQHHNMTGRELPGAPPPGNMPGAQMGPGGRPMPLPRMPNYGGSPQGILGIDDERQPLGGILGR